MFDKTKVLELIIEWFQQKNEGTKIITNENFFQLGYIDSLDTIELIEEFEQLFKIEFNEDDFQDRRFVNIKGLSEIILEKLKNA